MYEREKFNTSQLGACKMRTHWRIVDRGVNGEPFLWKKKDSGKFLMIDIFNPDATRRCYPIFVLPGNPNTNPNLSRTVIGVGCAEVSEETWIDAYQRARDIAEKYMKEH